MSTEKVAPKGMHVHTMKRDLPAALNLFMSLLMVLVALLRSLLLAH